MLQTCFLLHDSENLTIFIQITYWCIVPCDPVIRVPAANSSIHRIRIQKEERKDNTSPADGKTMHAVSTAFCFYSLAKFGRFLSWWETHMFRGRTNEETWIEEWKSMGEISRWCVFSEAITFLPKACVQTKTTTKIPDNERHCTVTSKLYYNAQVGGDKCFKMSFPCYKIKQGRCKAG